MQDLLTIFMAWFIHLDTHLLQLVTDHGNWVYLILFLVIFIETGVVVMPFLPGDSLLFIAGALGDALNFALGSWFKRRTLDASRIPFVKP